MTETVTVTPRFDRDDDGNPVPNGTPFDLEAFAVAPQAVGSKLNTAIDYTNSGDIDYLAFTVYFKEAQNVKDGDLIEVRGRLCNARIQLWENPYQAHGGFVVIAESMTGAS